MPSQCGNLVLHKSKFAFKLLLQFARCLLILQKSNFALKLLQFARCLLTITSCLHGAVVLIPVNKEADNLESEAIVQWYHPQQSQIANRRAGRKSQLLDIFGIWVPSSRMALQDLEPLPSPRVKGADVIDWDFEVEDSEGGVLIPFSTLDRVMECGIDITGLNVSQTRRGNLYRTHRLMQPALQR